MLSYILAVASAFLILIADQYSKYYIMSNFELYSTKGFIPGLLEITYIKNDGAAWGMFGGNKLFLIALTLIIMAVCIIYLVKFAKRNKMLFWAICIVLGGGLGNMIDRVFRDGNVVDFIQFSFWKSFPVFNLADCAIVIGSCLLILYFVIDLIKDFKKTENKEQEIAEENNGQF